MENEKRVFLACRAVFDGGNAQIRKPKAILKVVSQHRPACQTLLNDLGEKQLIGTLKSLLERKIFNSELKAKLAFPDLFTTSVTRDLQHNNSEADAARSEAEALADIAHLDGEGDDALNSSPALPNVELPSSVPPPKNQPTSSTAIPVQLVTDGIHIPSLYPLYFPYRTQHQILTRTQRLLEECCHNFTAQWLPELLEQRRWDCPEAIELNKWTHVVVKRLSKLPSHCFEDLAGDPPVSLASVLMSINNVRHSAVHRLHTTAKGISEMIRSATSFARALRDSTCQQQLNELHHELEGKIRALELNKNFLETRVEREMEDIARQRKELEQREEQVFATMLKEDKDYVSLIGSLLSQSVDQIFDKVKEDALEPSEGEQNLVPETEEEKEEPAINQETTHNAKLDAHIETGSLPSQDLELGKFLSDSGHHFPKTTQSVPSSPSTEDESEYKTEAAELEIKSLTSRDYDVPQEVHDLLAGILDEKVYTALSEAVDLKLSTISFSSENFKQLTDKRVKNIRKFAKHRTGFDVSRHQIELDDLIRTRFATFEAKGCQQIDHSKKKKKIKPSIAHDASHNKLIVPLSIPTDLSFCSPPTPLPRRLRSRRITPIVIRPASTNSDSRSSSLTNQLNEPTQLTEEPNQQNRELRPSWSRSSWVQNLFPTTDHDNVEDSFAESLYALW